MEDILKFLSALKQNNNREWFHEHKRWFLKVKNDHEELVVKLMEGISALDKNVPLIKPSECIFRIYRDVRFSKSKEPYKTAFGAVFSKGGRKGKYAGYYLHLEPDNSFAGGGIWRPDADVLKAIRYEIFNFPDEFINITKNKAFMNRFGEINGEKLVRPPKDFPLDFEHIELLKYKSLTVGQPYSDQELTNCNFYQHLTETFSTIKPFIGFLNNGIENT